jgi:hypothetical protein
MRVFELIFDLRSRKVVGYEEKSVFKGNKGYFRESEFLISLDDFIL